MMCLLSRPQLVDMLLHCQPQRVSVVLLRHNLQLLVGNRHPELRLLLHVLPLVRRTAVVQIWAQAMVVLDRLADIHPPIAVSSAACSQAALRLPSY